MLTVPSSKLWPFGHSVGALQGVRHPCSEVGMLPDRQMKGRTHTTAPREAVAAHKIKASTLRLEQAGLLNPGPCEALLI